MDQGGTLAKRSRFSEEQIIAVLKEQKAGPKTGDICRRHGISHATFYAWRKKHGGTEVSDARRLKALEDEEANARSVAKKINMRTLQKSGGESRAQVIRCDEHPGEPPL